MNKGRIVRFLRKLIQEFYQDFYYFSPKLAIVRAVGTISGAIRMRKLSSKMNRKRDSYVIEYIKIHYGYIFEKYRNYVDSGKPYNSKNSPIWVAWLDGLEKAPPLVQVCIASIIRHAGTHPVHIITWENYEQFVYIPEIIVAKAKDHIIKPAHFSDILRVSLLAEHGGIWLDATIFCAHPIPDDYFEMKLFTCKSSILDDRWISKNQWTTFVLGGFAQNELYLSLRDFFEQYWIRESCAIDYLFFDGAIKTACTFIPNVKEWMAQIPCTNEKRDALILRFAEPWTPGCVDDLLQSDTVFFKLGYRETCFLQESTSKGELTVYGAFVRGAV